MKALDTSVLMKYVTDDKNKQRERLEALLLRNTDTTHFFVNDVVIVELTELLEENIKFDRFHIEEIVNELLLNDKIVLQSGKSIREALHLYKNNNIPFADCMKDVFNNERNCTETIRKVDRKTGSTAYSKLAG